MRDILLNNAYSFFWLVVMAIVALTISSADLQSRLEAQLRTHLGATLRELGAAVPRIDLRLVRADPLYKARRLVLLRSWHRKYSVRILLVCGSAEEAKRLQSVSSEIRRGLQHRLAASSSGVGEVVAIAVQCVAAAEVPELTRRHPEMFGPTALERALKPRSAHRAP